MALNLSVDTPTPVEHAPGPGVVVPDSPAELFGSFAGAAVVGQAAADLDALRTSEAWLYWKRQSIAGGRWFGTDEGVAWRVEVSPGSIAVRRRDYARAERAVERLRATEWLMRDLRAAGEVLAGPACGVGCAHVTCRVIRHDGPLRRGRITSWSAKSRANMVQRLATLDYGPLIEQGTPAMITLTYPGDWLTVAPSAEVTQRHIRALQLRWRRRWGTKLVGVWKREFQDRGAPHWHILAVPPAGRDFDLWISRTWAAIVDHPDAEQRRRHEAAGTNVDRREGARYADPRRVGVYFSKHGSFAAKDYQNEAPAEWLADDQAGIGRFWGVWGLSKAVATVEVPADLADELRRTARRWQAGTVLRDRDTGAPATMKVRTFRKKYRIDHATGEVLGWKWKRRNVTRRIPPRLGGRAGFLCVNDGPGLVLQLARLLESGPRSSYREWNRC